MKFRKKPVIIEAIQWDGYQTTYDKIVKEFNAKDILAPLTRDGKLYVKTLEGIHEANMYDWIIQGVKGEVYPCKPDIFEMTYEKVEQYEYR